MEDILATLTLLLYINALACVDATDHCTKDGCKESVFLGDFNIPTSPLPRLSITDPIVKQRISEQLPTVITGSDFLSSDRGVDLAYLNEIFKTSKSLWNVFVGKSRRFLYYQSNSNLANFKWLPPHGVQEMVFDDFNKLYKKTADSGGTGRIYLQSRVSPEDLVGSGIQVNASTIRHLRRIIEPRETFYSRAAVLFVGMPDVLTPLHFDHSNNLFAQIFGRKRCILIGPEHYSNLYPYPKHHPHDRQSRVDEGNPNYERFPNFRQVSGYEAILSPGDVLYIPTAWWHLVESERGSETVSMSFKFAPSDYEFLVSYIPEMAHPIPFRNATVKYFSAEQWEEKRQEELTVFGRTGVPYFERPDSLVRQVHLWRLIEELIAVSTGNYRDVGKVLKEIYDGRFDDLDFNHES